MNYANMIEEKNLKVRLKKICANAPSAMLTRVIVE
jgi:hypothetical protein